ncbi:Thiamine-phosphate synthase [bacterium HR40]|nr:Thiamine-phosphate synthase [bacterium HR40]
MKPTVDLRLYAILDPALLGGRDPVACARAAVAGGCTLLQLRDKRYAARPVIDLARRLNDVLRPAGVPLVVDDRVDVALAAGAAGVHLGREDMAPEDARRILGPQAIVGVTAHRPEEVDGVVAGIADYVGIGPVFATRSKDPGDPPIGPEGLSRLVARLHRRLPGFPVVAIAGIDEENASSVIAAGAQGIAVISALFSAPDIEAAAGRLRRIVDAALALRRDQP